MISYQLVRSKRRKTLGLQVKHGQVTVRAPYYVTTDFIESFIKEKSAWLHSKILAQNNVELFCDFSHNSPILYLGEQVVINVRVAKKASVYISDITPAMQEVKPLQNQGVSYSKQINVVISERVDNSLFDASTSAKQVKKQIEAFFKQQAEQIITQRLTSIVEQTSLTPSKVNIRQYRARWGSCNNRREVSFNYLLMMAPLFVMDYVIIHELCHLTFLNHSQQFWLLVEKHCSNYKEAKNWLKSHQTQLCWQLPR